MTKTSLPAFACALIAIPVIGAGVTSHNPIMLALSLMEAIFLLVFAWALRTLGRRAKARPAAWARVDANVMELAAWLARDPAVDATSRERFARLMTDLEPAMASADDDGRHALAGVIMQTMRTLHGGEPYVNVLAAYANTMEAEPEHWEALDMSYRTTMARAADGDDMRGTAIPVSVSPHTVIMIPIA